MTNTSSFRKSMNGIITLTDGIAIMENGNITANDINSGSHQTTTIYCDNIIRNVNPSTANIYTTGLAGSIINVGNSNTTLNLNNAVFTGGGDIDALKIKSQHQTANSTQTLFSNYTVCNHLQCNDLAFKNDCWGLYTNNCI